MKFKFEHMSLTQLGQLFGVSNQGIGKWLKSLDLRDEEGLPTQTARDGRYCKQIAAGDKGTLWVWDTEKTVAALKAAGHSMLLAPPISLMSPAILNGPFSVRTTGTSVCVIENGDHSTCIHVNSSMTADVVVRILNAAHGTGTIDRLCQTQKLLQTPLASQNEIDSVVKPFE